MDKKEWETALTFPTTEEVEGSSNSIRIHGLRRSKLLDEKREKRIEMSELKIDFVWLLWSSRLYLRCGE